MSRLKRPIDSSCIIMKISLGILKSMFLSELCIIQFKLPARYWQAMQGYIPLPLVVALPQTPKWQERCLRPCHFKPRCVCCAHCWCA